MSEEVTFGSFIRTKRIGLENYISLRKMAELLGLSPVHMSNIETGRDAAPRKEVLEGLAQHLQLTKKETEQMYELAAKSKNYVAVPGDLPEYISAHEYARIALRVAKDVDATDLEWQEFIEKLKKRSQQEQEDKPE
jgi:transcriptional regulator with XRE-family HTH domain